MSIETYFPSYRPPGGRRAPDHIQRLLRQVDPSAELLYAGAGVWQLVKYRPNRLLIARVEGSIGRLLQHLGKAGQGSIVIPPTVKREIAFRFWWWHLLRFGARPVARYPSEPGSRIYGEPGSWIVDDFRRRTWRAQHELEIALAERELEWDADKDLEKAQERMREYVNLMHRDIHRHAFRRPVISHGGRKVG